MISFKGRMLPLVLGLRVNRDHILVGHQHDRGQVGLGALPLIDERIIADAGPFQREVGFRVSLQEVALQVQEGHKSGRIAIDGENGRVAQRAGHPVGNGCRVDVHLDGRFHRLERLAKPDGAEQHESQHEQDQDKQNDQGIDEHGVFLGEWI